MHSNIKLSIIIPVFNEKKTILSVLEKLASLHLPVHREIIIVDDGSTDGTRNQITDNIKHITRKNQIRIIYHKQNQGKGAAVKTGVKVAIGDYILIQDADLEYNPDEIPKLIVPILKEKNQTIAVYGSRFSSHNYSIPLLYFLGNKFLTVLSNMLYGTGLTDMETGYKLLPASFLKKTQLIAQRFDVEPEITAKLVKKGIRIVEVPISYRSRSHVAGKKLTLKDAFGAVKTLLINRL